MKRIIKAFSIISFIFVIALSFALVTSAETRNVVYVSSNGRGNGSSPDSPIGNAAGYKTANGTDVNNAFYRALDKLTEDGLIARQGREIEILDRQAIQKNYQ